MANRYFSVGFVDPGELPWLVVLELQYEDELPKDITDAEYDEWYSRSVIVDGVRMGPVFERGAYA